MPRTSSKESANVITLLEILGIGCEHIFTNIMNDICERNILIIQEEHLTGIIVDSVILGESTVFVGAVQYLFC